MILPILKTLNNTYLYDKPLIGRFDWRLSNCIDTLYTVNHYSLIDKLSHHFEKKFERKMEDEMLSFGPVNRPLPRIYAMTRYPQRTTQRMPFSNMCYYGNHYGNFYSKYVCIYCLQRAQVRTCQKRMKYNKHMKKFLNNNYKPSANQHHYITTANQHHYITGMDQTVYPVNNSKPQLKKKQKRKQFCYSSATNQHCYTINHALNSSNNNCRANGGTRISLSEMKFLDSRKTNNCENICQECFKPHINEERKKKHKRMMFYNTAVNTGRNIIWCKQQRNMIYADNMCLEFYQCTITMSDCLIAELRRLKLSIVNTSMELKSMETTVLLSAKEFHGMSARLVLKSMPKPICFFKRKLQITEDGLGMMKVKRDDQRKCLKPFSNRLAYYLRKIMCKFLGVRLVRSKTFGHQNVFIDNFRLNLFQKKELPRIMSVLSTKGYHLIFYWILSVENTLDRTFILYFVQRKAMSRNHWREKINQKSFWAIMIIGK